MNVEMKKLSVLKSAKNYRDIGDIADLELSIKEKGIIQPLGVQGDGTIVFGHRRFAAAKSLGLEDVPVIIVEAKDSSSRLELQIVENVHRLQAKPVEEARAFQEYTNGDKQLVKTLAGKIGKSELYVKRRLSLLKLHKDVQEALDKGVIKLGHAELLGQLKLKQQKEVLEDYVLDSWNEDEVHLTVEELAEALSFLDQVDLLDHHTVPADEKQQSLMDSVASRLDAEGNVASAKSLAKEVARYLAKERKRLQDLGILVFESVEAAKEKHPDAEVLEKGYYGDSQKVYAAAVSNLKKSDKYGLALYVNDRGDVRKDVLRLVAPPKKKEDVESADPKAVERAEKELEMSRKKRLENKLRSFAHEKRVAFNANKVLSEDFDAKQLRILMIYKALQSYETRSIAAGVLSRDLKAGFNLIQHNDKTLWAQLQQLSDNNLTLLEKSIARSGIGDNHAWHVSKTLGFDWKNDFSMESNKDVLDLYTKDQLLDMVGKTSLDGTPSGKVSAIREEIADSWKAGELPTLLEKY